jgi:hypothetical protein
VPRVETIDALIKFYETFGYSETPTGEYEEGFEKIAIYATAFGKPTHAARQVGPTTWASKLGNWYDIEHTKDAVSGGSYGEVVKYMQRPKPANP